MAVRPSFHRGIHETMNQYFSRKRKQNFACFEKYYVNNNTNQGTSNVSNNNFNEVMRDDFVTENSGSDFPKSFHELFSEVFDFLNNQTNSDDLSFRFSDLELFGGQFHVDGALTCSTRNTIKAEILDFDEGFVFNPKRLNCSGKKLDVKEVFVKKKIPKEDEGVKESSKEIDTLVLGVLGEQVKVNKPLTCSTSNTIKAERLDFEEGFVSDSKRLSCSGLQLEDKKSIAKKRKIPNKEDERDKESSKEGNIVVLSLPALQYCPWRNKNGSVKKSKRPWGKRLSNV